MIKNSTKKALLEVGDFTRQAIIVCGLSTVYYTIHALCSQGDVNGTMFELMEIPTNGGETN